MRFIARRDGADIPVEVERYGSGYRVKLGETLLVVDVVETGRSIHSLRLEDATQAARRRGDAVGRERARAARKCEFDLHPKQQGEDAVLVRLLLHAGEVTTKDGTVVGDPITKGFAALAELPPQQQEHPAAGDSHHREGADRRCLFLSYFVVVQRGNDPCN